MKPNRSLALPLSLTPGVALRVAADFAIVQMAALIALVVVALRLEDTPTLTAEMGLTLLREYYVNLFLPLSLLFPAVNAVYGLYTTTRNYSLFYKLRRAALSATAATLTLVFLNFLLTRTEELPRSAAVMFGVLVIAGMPGSRWIKQWMFDRDAEQNRGRGRAADKVLVVGGAGYIGSMLVGKLLDRGYRVQLLDSLVYGNGAIREFLGHPRLEFIEGDCRNVKDLVRAMDGVGDVIDLAAVVGDPACEQDRRNALEINYAATRMMIEVAKGYGVKRFLFASSCSVYGSSEYLMDEYSKTAPISLYGETKVNSEKVLLEASTETFHPTVLRFATVFGLSPRPRFDLVVNLLTAKALQEGVITVFNGQQWRPFIHVGDVAEALIRTLEAPVEAVSGEIFNVGDSRLNYTLTQVAQHIQAEFPDTRIENSDSADKRNYRVSFEKIRGRIGFECQRTLDEGIRELKQAFLRGEIADYKDSSYSNVRFLQERGDLAVKDEISMELMAALSGTKVVAQGAASG